MRVIRETKKFSMKGCITAFTFFFTITAGSYGQVAESAKNLRTQPSDTIANWKKGGIFGLNISQASFTNWAAGGQNSFAVNSLLSVFVNYKNETSAWDNTLDIGYGLLQQGKKGKFIKTDDKLDLSSKFGKKATKPWYYTMLVNFKTQMANGYNYPNDSVMISSFMAPAYLIAAIGFDYRPNEHFSAFIAPISSKNTFVNNSTLADAGAFGVEKAAYSATGTLIKNGKKFRTELGGYVKVAYQTGFFPDTSVTLLTKLDLFSNYLAPTRNIDISWETVVGFKVNQYITASIATHLLYDDDIAISVDRNEDGVIDAVGPRTQFKEVIAIGLSYKF